MDSGFAMAAHFNLKKMKKKMTRERKKKKSSVHIAKKKSSVHIALPHVSGEGSGYGYPQGPPGEGSGYGYQGPTNEKNVLEVLHNWCERNGTTPFYDFELRPPKKAGSNPKHVCRVSVGKLNASGEGPSKKAAKYEAASSALRALAGAAHPKANYILALKTVAARRDERPQYQFIRKQGRGREREFVITCHLENYKATGTGRAEKHAKQSAAYQVMEQMKAALGPENPIFANLGHGVDPENHDDPGNCEDEDMDPDTFEDQD